MTHGSIRIALNATAVSLRLQIILTYDSLWFGGRESTYTAGCFPLESLMVVGEKCPRTVLTYELFLKQRWSFSTDRLHFDYCNSQTIFIMNFVNRKPDSV